MNTKILLCLGITLLISSCHPTRQGLPLNQQPSEEETPPVLYVENPSFLDNSELAIIPVGLSAKSSKFRGYGSFSQSDSGLFSGSQIDKGGYSLIATNILFYNRQTEAINPLLDQKAIISQFNYLYYRNLTTGNSSLEAREKDFPQLLIYHLINDDTNQDEKLDQQDASLVYLSDFSGNNFTQISPDQTQVKQWDYFPDQNIILLNLGEDRNEDNKFDSPEDANSAYLYNLEDQSLTQLNPPNTDFINWKIDPDYNRLYLRLREDSNEDNQFDETDTIKLVKINLDNLEQTVPLIDQELYNSLHQLTFE
ncbi:hypothetical protein PN462_16670 [Spirulina sp. CS-785/01]|uniref:hypothetical protein n=1 Tax=Spirulina sp. CS-785/01 TaxID=3021716 RepID=UPI00232BC906|nr:hypothetical protein [Spirulina sp. CS-785/01]MDB9314749.1 hypothetical protein [Spirulina sp. CS-785/01]